MAHNDVANKGRSDLRADCAVLVALETDNPDDRRHGSVMLVVPSHAMRPILPPGGAVREGERIGDAAARELLEETGLRRTITQGLAVDQSLASEPAGPPEGITFVCDGSTISTADAMAMAIPVRSEITAFAWVHPDRLYKELSAYQARRIEVALTAREQGSGYLLLAEGEPYGTDARRTVAATK
ncbi:NUDIX domain-containing protein [Kitasatospora sp. SolWspMP-SS2h]|uniref:NUDIX domain-containing protein n=1 Tax=Kitasatospora sp. SolWspMP-SS2h TaxID=1305729 RepID=UPI000DBA0BD7|nr:NUDIX domain-containing protein [Kitasatospora sp. SolWspMP-SS2h]RAJ47163.1 NUDIX domain-containing protein [Kitasatospora sp. SolWspMP-SS2h]